MDKSEYDEARKDTLEQLKELNDSLKKVAANNMSLVDAMGAMQLVWLGIVWRVTTLDWHYENYLYSSKIQLHGLSFTFPC